MLTPLETAKLYFELSNSADVRAVEDLFTEASTYSSQNTGIYFGREDIIEMQRVFHGKFSSLQWSVNSVEEVKPGVILFDFNFMGETLGGERVKIFGLEYVVVYKGKIQHIEVRNKAKANELH